MNEWDQAFRMVGEEMNEDVGERMNEDAGGVKERREDVEERESERWWKRVEPRLK